MAPDAMKNRLLPFLLALVAAAVILKSAAVIESSQMESATVARHRDAVVQLGAMRARLENALNARLYVAHALAAYVASNTELSQAAFVPFAQALIARQPGIRSVALIRGTTVTHMYPNGVDWLMAGDDTTRLPEEQAELLQARERHEPQAEERGGGGDGAEPDADADAAEFTHGVDRSEPARETVAIGHEQQDEAVVSEAEEHCRPTGRGRRELDARDLVQG
jgi:hypothetical protein